ILYYTYIFISVTCWLRHITKLNECAGCSKPFPIPPRSGVFNLFQPKDPLAERDTEQGPPPLPPHIWACYSYNLFGTKCQSHTHTPLHMFEQNYKSSVTQNSFQFILFIIDIFSPLQLAITLYSIREGQRIE